MISLFAALQVKVLIKNCCHFNDQFHIIWNDLITLEQIVRWKLLRSLFLKTFRTQPPGRSFRNNIIYLLTCWTSSKSFMLYINLSFKPITPRIRESSWPFSFCNLEGAKRRKFVSFRLLVWNLSKINNISCKKWTQFLPCLNKQKPERILQRSHLKWIRQED